MSIGPPIPEIQHFLNLTLKIQGQGHSSRSQSRYNTLSTHIPFVPCRSTLPFLGYSNGANGQITMTVHNYRSRQVHETLSCLYWVNPSSGFRDMRSAKSGPNLWQIWQVFGPWASPYGVNGCMSMTVHNYRSRQFHRTSNGENPSSGYRDMGSASLAAARPTAGLPVPPSARPPRPWWQYPFSPEGWGVKRQKTQTWKCFPKDLQILSNSTVFPP